MVRHLLLILPVLGLAACAVPVAQPVYAPPPPPAPPNLAERLAVDQQRISEGLRLGQFTPPEYNELQGRHDAIEGTRREQLAEGGGRFAPGQYEQLAARESALSRSIFEYRHNGATPTAH